MSNKKKEVVKVQLTFTKKQMELIRSYRDIFGESDAEIVRSIVTNWLISKNDAPTKNRK